MEVILSSGDTDSDVSIYDTTDNVSQFQQMIKLCRKNIQFPKAYVEDMNKMYDSCNNKQRNSKKLRNFIHEGVQHISVKNKKSFQFAADVYNELLQLSKKDSTSSQNEDCIASTSNGITSMTELENGNTMSSEIFESFIQKCYQNPNFPNSNIDKIDKLYQSLPSEFVDSKYFLRLLKEADKVIWPDSSSSFYIHIEHIYEQLLQFQSSMTCQDRIISIENKEINQKKLKKLAQLKKALRIARMKVKTLDTSEMDINNDDDFGSDSLYILKDKYEKRIVEIYKRMCKLKDEPDFLEQPPLRFKDTNNPLVNKTIEKFYNINKEFPDYFEIFTLLKLLNEKKKLNWTKQQLQNISHNAFLKLGKRLKGNRLNEYFGHLSTITIEEDPAEKSEELKKKLEESNKKLLDDLTLVRETFINKQDCAEETEVSSLNNSECEISSEDELAKKNINKDSKYIKPISIKQKRQLSYNSEDGKSPKKSKKTVYMESFNLTPCPATVDKLNLIKEKSNNDSIYSTDKNTADVNDDSIYITDKTIVVNEGIVPNKNSNIVLKNIDNSEENINTNILITDGSISGTEGDATLVIDEDLKDNVNDKPVNENPPEIKIQPAKIKDNLMRINTETDDNISNHPIVTEPIEVVHENKDDVIELNELDDSDVEITSYETPRVPIQNKKSLENIIKSMNFEKKYKFDQKKSSIRQPPVDVPLRDGHRGHFGNKQNSKNLVNCWIMNNGRPPRPMNTRPSRPMNTRRDNNNRMQQQQQQHTNRRMQSSIQRSMAQTTRHFSQPYPNVINQQRHFFNNQSLFQQRVTTMTTTTVRQVVQQSSGSISQMNHSILQSNNHAKPELIELD